MVYLIGAGPGDPSLITVRGRDLLRQADVVLYDRLAAEVLLLETKPGCELIDVGKSAGSHTRSQDETCRLLVEYGAQGGCVVRLKGGDPYLFGRGGEEAEALAEAGVSFEVVPGVSALQAVTASAGIPVTHRDFASSLGVATGHGAAGKTDDPIRWRELACGVDTVVVFMGVGALRTIVSELIAGGKPADTPAALIERGATPRQRVVTATLGTIADRAETEQVKPPALFVCGPTVTLADKLAWYTPGPLAGLRIGVTRPFAQSKSFADRLTGLGAVPVLMPSIEIEYTQDRPDVSAALNDLDSFDIIAFSSANGIDSFFSALNRHGGDARDLAGMVLAAIGPATADALGRYGLTADVEAATFVAEGLLEALLDAHEVNGRRILLVRSDIGRETLREGLEAAGALVTQAVFYATKTVSPRPYIKQLLRDGGIDMITFTSSSTVDGVFTALAADELADGIVFASIGPQTSAALRRHGREPQIEAAEYTTDGLIAAILEQYHKDK